MPGVPWMGHPVSPAELGSLSRDSQLPSHGFISSLFFCLLSCRSLSCLHFCIFYSRLSITGSSTPPISSAMTPKSAATCPTTSLSFPLLKMTQENNKRKKGKNRKEKPTTTMKPGHEKNGRRTTAVVHLSTLAPEGCRPIKQQQQQQQLQQGKMSTSTKTTTPCRRCCMGGSQRMLPIWSFEWSTLLAWNVSKQHERHQHRPTLPSPMCSYGTFGFSLWPMRWL